MVAFFNSVRKVVMYIIPHRFCSSRVIGDLFGIYILDYSGSSDDLRRQFWRSLSESVDERFGGDNAPPLTVHPHS